MPEGFKCTDKARASQAASAPIAFQEAPPRKSHRKWSGESLIAICLCENLSLIQDVGNSRAGAEEQEVLPSGPRAQDLR